MAEALLVGVPVRIDSRVAPTQILLLGGEVREGIVVGVETYWHLRYPGWWARFACELRRRTLERLV